MDTSGELRLGSNAGPDRSSPARQLRVAVALAGISLVPSSSADKIPRSAIQARSGDRCGQPGVSGRLWRRPSIFGAAAPASAVASRGARVVDIGERHGRAGADPAGHGVEPHPDLGTDQITPPRQGVVTRTSEVRDTLAMLQCLAHSSCGRVPAHAARPATTVATKTVGAPMEHT